MVVGFGPVGGFCFTGAGNTSADNDGDKIPDSVEGIKDVDGDTLPNYRDLDSDGDGLPDAVEVGDPCNPNACGPVAAYLSADSDGDGIPDGEEAPGQLCVPQTMDQVGSVSATATTASSTLGVQASNSATASTGANTLGTGGATMTTATETTGTTIAEGGAAGEGGEGGVSSFETQR